MKKIFLLITCSALLSVSLYSNERPVGHPLVQGINAHQLVSSSREASPIPPRKDLSHVDQGIWGKLEQEFPFKLVSTAEEFYDQVVRYQTLTQNWEQNKVLLTTTQNQITELDCTEPVSLIKRTTQGIKKIIASACTLLATATISQKLDHSKEMLPVKTGTTTIGLAVSAYLLAKGIGSFKQPSTQDILVLKNKLNILQNEVTTTKLYLTEYAAILKKHTVFHKNNPTPYTSGEYNLMFGSTNTPE